MVSVVKHRDAKFQAVDQVRELLEAISHDNYEETMKALDILGRYNPLVFQTRVDDSHFSSSDLIFVVIPGMGTQVFFVPQCSGDPVTEFFLYPGDMEGLIETLQKIRGVNG